MWWFPILVTGLLVVDLTGGRVQAETSKGELMAKVSPDLAVLSDEYKLFVAQRGGEVFKPTNPLLRIIDERVVIDAVASDDVHALQADLEALGMQEAVAFGRIVSGQLPISAIEDTALLASLQFVRPAYATTHIGPLSPERPHAPTAGPTREKRGDPLNID
jgi:hypothetical protein